MKPLILYKDNKQIKIYIKPIKRLLNPNSFFIKNKIKTAIKANKRISIFPWKRVRNEIKKPPIHWLRLSETLHIPLELSHKVLRTVYTEAKSKEMLIPIFNRDEVYVFLYFFKYKIVYKNIMGPKMTVVSNVS